MVVGDYCGVGWGGDADGCVDFCGFVGYGYSVADCDSYVDFGYGSYCG